MPDDERVYNAIERLRLDLEAMKVVQAEQRTRLQTVEQALNTRALEDQRLQDRWWRIAIPVLIGTLVAIFSGVAALMKVWFGGP